MTRGGSRVCSKCQHFAHLTTPQGVAVMSRRPCRVRAGVRRAPRAAPGRAAPPTPLGGYVTRGGSQVCRQASRARPCRPYPLRPQIRIDVVAGMDEEVRSVAQHGRIGAHAAARLVDPPALAGLVARPGERDRPPVARRGAKAAVGEPMVVFFLSRRHARGLFRASVK